MALSTEGPAGARGAGAALAGAAAVAIGAALVWTDVLAAEG